MAKKETAEAAATNEGNTGKGQGRAVVLPNGQRRVDYIRDQYYSGGKSRSDIKNEINQMYEDAQRADEQIPYQIVFAATKTGECGKPDTDPRNQPKEPKGGKADAPAE